MDRDLALLAEIIRTTPGVRVVLAEAVGLAEAGHRMAAELSVAAAADVVCEAWPDRFTPADPIRLRDYLIRTFLPPEPPPRHH